MSDRGEAFDTAFLVGWALGLVAMILHGALWALGAVSADALTWWLAAAFLIASDIVWVADYADSRWFRE